MDKAQIQHLIERQNQLSGITANHAILVQALSTPELGPREIAEIVRHYPSISGRLIFLANSAWAAPRVPIETIEMACVRLGVPVVKGVSISLSVSSLFNTRRCSLFNGNQLWISALLVADGAANLASMNPNTAYTAGLLHNMGLLWLAEHCPDETSTAIGLVQEDQSLSLFSALRSTTGADYCEVGGILARTWNLPEVLVDAIEKYHQPQHYESKFSTTQWVGFATQMVAALLKGADACPEIEAIKYSDLHREDLENTFHYLENKRGEIQELVDTMMTEAA